MILFTKGKQKQRETRDKEETQMIFFYKALSSKKQKETTDKEETQNNFTILAFRVQTLFWGERSGRRSNKVKKELELQDLCQLHPPDVHNHPPDVHLQPPVVHLYPLAVHLHPPVVHPESSAFHCIDVFGHSLPTYSTRCSTRDIAEMSSTVF